MTEEGGARLSGHGEFFQLEHTPEGPGGPGNILVRFSRWVITSPVAWLVALFNEIKAGLQGEQAKVTRKAIVALRSYNSFSNQKAKTLLGWTPRIDLEEGMQLTERWLRDEGYLNN